MARQYVLADEMYASDFDISSFESHQYIIAGVNPKSSVDYPQNGAAWGCTGDPGDEIEILEGDLDHADLRGFRPCGLQLGSRTVVGCGYRLPLLIISPYARKGVVSHTHFEHGSILRFVEETFGLKALAASDKRANSPDDAFDFSQSPRTFVPIKAPYDAGYFIRQPLDTRAPDTN